MSRRSKSADQRVQIFASEGRRHTAPPRRFPVAVNDNRGPLGQRLKKAGFVALLAMMAAAIVWMETT
ncbi:hypothetical protein MSR1_09210 [Magnetospirillum gryphiswaldense MSR-1]|uniref:Uncharacterized protein n=1 Tax=Magnetospirillum gryphiswaldense TaxID=55518 RepID=A4TVL3_9PROT|nr:hypothetical protein MSR1_09210 [Magnetospirillum gryphiswaldense MSR-1]AVM77326.1 hypothetical protein MSR1L_09210 [Magnetospirillum gryphiswaldense]CAM74670.1 hypothetical protein MGR_0882 [Magnetospirillum gryphiswaldense MSR-1]